MSLTNYEFDVKIDSVKVSEIEALVTIVVDADESSTDPQTAENILETLLGDDYVDGSYTGNDIDIPIQFINRNHEYSTTKLKQQIYNSITERTI